MKRFLVIGALAAALAAFPVTHTAHADKPAFNASKVCQAWAEDAPRLFDFFFDSHGDCVSSLRSNRNDGIVRFCKAWSERDPRWFPFPFKNIGQCVSFYRTR